MDFRNVQKSTKNRNCWGLEIGQTVLYRIWLSGAKTLDHKWGAHSAPRPPAGDVFFIKSQTVLVKNPASAPENLLLLL